MSTVNTTSVTRILIQEKEEFSRELNKELSIHVFYLNVTEQQRSAFCWNREKESKREHAKEESYHCSQPDRFFKWEWVQAFLSWHWFWLCQSWMFLGGQSQKRRVASMHSAAQQMISPLPPIQQRHEFKIMTSIIKIKCGFHILTHVFLWFPKDLPAPCTGFHP